MNPQDRKLYLPWIVPCTRRTCLSKNFIYSWYSTSFGSCYCKKTSVFYESLLLLKICFVITLSKFSIYLARAALCKWVTCTRQTCFQKLIYSRYLTSFGSCYCKKNKLTSVFLCVCPLIEDKFRHNLLSQRWAVSSPFYCHIRQWGKGLWWKKLNSFAKSARMSHRMSQVLVSTSSAHSAMEHQYGGWSRLSWRYANLSREWKRSIVSKTIFTGLSS